MYSWISDLTTTLRILRLMTGINEIMDLKVPGMIHSGCCHIKMDFIFLIPALPLHHIAAFGAFTI